MDFILENTEYNFLIQTTITINKNKNLSKRRNLGTIIKINEERLNYFIKISKNKKESFMQKKKTSVNSVTTCNVVPNKLYLDAKKFMLLKSANSKYNQSQFKTEYFKYNQIKSTISCFETKIISIGGNTKEKSNFQLKYFIYCLPSNVELRDITHQANIYLGHFIDKFKVHFNIEKFKEWIAQLLNVSCCHEQNSFSGLVVSFNTNLPIFSKKVNNNNNNNNDNTLSEDSDLSSSQKIKVEYISKKRKFMVFDTCEFIISSNENDLPFYLNEINNILNNFLTMENENLKHEWFIQDSTQEKIDNEIQKIKNFLPTDVEYLKKNGNNGFNMKENNDRKEESNSNNNNEKYSFNNFGIKNNNQMMKFNKSNKNKKKDSVTKLLKTYDKSIESSNKINQINFKNLEEVKNFNNLVDTIYHV